MAAKTSTILTLLASLSITTGALAKSCELSIEGNNAMQYNTKELTVGKDCTDVKLTLKHSGTLPKSAMGHDWVLTKAADMQGVVNDSMAAGPTKDYLPAKDDKRVIAATTLVGGGESATTTFKASDLKAGESYKFFCTFPGHSAMMNGVLKVEGGAAKS